MSKYVEKDFLCEYDLSKTFFDYMNIKPEEVRPLRKVFVVKTEEGEKILKKVSYGEEKINFIEKSLEYINQKFNNTMRINKLENGKNFVEWKNSYYIVMDKVKGEEGAYTNPLDLEACTSAIAQLHKASKGIVDYLDEKEVERFKGENIITLYEKAYEDLENIQEWVKKYRYLNEFDRLLLANVDEYKAEIKECIDKIKNSKYSSMIENNELLSLCHNDLAYHNFLIEGDSASIIDFDYANVNLRCVDVADFLLKWIKNSTFNKEKAEKIIEKYNEVLKLNKDELDLVKIFLTFPRDVYSIIRVYYHKEKTWQYESFLNKFKNKLANDEYRRIFLKEE